MQSHWNKYSRNKYTIWDMKIIFSTLAVFHWMCVYKWWMWRTAITLITFCYSIIITHQKVMNEIVIPRIKCLSTQFEQKPWTSIFEVFNVTVEPASCLLIYLTSFGLTATLLADDNVHRKFSSLCCRDTSRREIRLTEVWMAEEFEVISADLIYSFLTCIQNEANNDVFSRFIFSPRS